MPRKEVFSLAGHLVKTEKEYHNHLMFKEPKESAESSFEEAAKRDTFEDLRAKIMPLIADERYEEAQRDIKGELRLLARALGGPEDERFREVRAEFDRFLPEETRLLVSSETPEARGRTIRKRAAEIPDPVPEDDAVRQASAPEKLKEAAYGKPPTSLEEAWQRLEEWWRDRERLEKGIKEELRSSPQFDKMAPDHVDDRFDAENTAEASWGEQAEDFFLDFWRKGIPARFKPEIVDRLMEEKRIGMLRLLHKFNGLAFLDQEKMKLVKSRLGLGK